MPVEEVWNGEGRIEKLAGTEVEDGHDGHREEVELLRTSHLRLQQGIGLQDVDPVEDVKVSKRAGVSW